MNNSRIIHLDSLNSFLNRHHDIADNAIYFANFNTLIKILSSFKLESVLDITPPIFWCYGYQFRVFAELKDDEVLIII